MEPPPLTRAEVAKHTSENDCWIIIKKQVYDVTAWLDFHPGGSRILLAYAGKDATTPFREVRHPRGVIEANSKYVKHLGPLVRKSLPSKETSPEITDPTKEDPQGGNTLLSTSAESHPTSAEEEAAAAAMSAEAPQVSPEKVISRAELATHNTRESCWIAIDEQVYDVTDWLDYHPGGTFALLSFGGTDATAVFNTVRHPAGAIKANSAFVKHLGALGPVDDSWMPTRADVEVGYTKEEVAKHRTREDCWMIINGNVYDVTKLLPMHPGGDFALMTFAGADASLEFNMFHEPAAALEAMAPYMELKGQLVISPPPATQATDKFPAERTIQTQSTCGSVTSLSAPL